MIVEPGHENSITYALSKDSDQPAYQSSLIRVFISALKMFGPQLSIESTEKTLIRLCANVNCRNCCCPAHTLGTFYARKMKFGMLLTQARKLVVAIWAKSKGWGHLCSLDTCLFSLFFFSGIRTMICSYYCYDVIRGIVFNCTFCLKLSCYLFSYK